MNCQVRYILKHDYFYFYAQDKTDSVANISEWMQALDTCSKHEQLESKINICPINGTTSRILEVKNQKMYESDHYIISRSGKLLNS